jgi:hypothetical protein
MLCNKLHFASQYHGSDVYMNFTFQAYGLHNAHVPLEREYHINGTR